MVLRSDTEDIEQKIRDRIGEYVKEVRYEDEENCVKVSVSRDPQKLVEEVESLGDHYGIRVQEDSFKIY
jgi:hypothetical protein